MWRRARRPIAGSCVTVRTSWLPIGVGAGVAIGVALGNIGVGLAIGAAIGVLLSYALGQTGDDDGDRL